MNTITIVVPAADHRVGGRETIPRWSDLSRLALGAWTFSMPLLALAIASASLVLRPTPALLAAAMALVSGHAIITMLYGAFAVQNPRIARWRTAWLLALLVAGPVFIPVYWVVHVWRAPRVGRPNVDGPSPGFDLVELQPHPA